MFAWLFPYKSPEMCHVFRQVSFLMICHYVAVLPIAALLRGFYYRYITPFNPTHEHANISDNSIQLY